MADIRARGDVIAPASNPSAWPVLGSHVRLCQYSEGNTLRGDHKHLAWDIDGIVIESPRSGSNYLIVKPDPAQSLPTEALYDDTDREACTISDRYVALHRKEFWRWTLSVLTPPPPPEPLTIEVGDQVTFKPKRPITEGDDSAWAKRVGGTYLVMARHQGAAGGTHDSRNTYKVIEVRDHYVSSWEAPDEFYLDDTNAALVAKASYTPVP